MIVDLHSHLPMHVRPDAEDALGSLRARRHASVRDWIRYGLLEVASYVANYPDMHGPAVTLPELEAGDVGVALSCLFSAFNEFDPTRMDGDPPEPHYVADLTHLMDDVEGEVAAHPAHAEIATDWQELSAIRASGKTAVVHCVEGGFHLGATPTQIRATLGRLADRGVAYLTVAHLFYRQLATNKAAIPFLRDRWYHWLFPQPAIGLATLGWSAVHACVEQGILVDISHMSSRSVTDLLGWLDVVDPSKEIPVLATHVAAAIEPRTSPEYNLDDPCIRRVAERGGVVGVILCPHYLAGAAGVSSPRTRQESVELVARHATHIAGVAGTWDCVGLGSDMDGFTKPALSGLERARDLHGLEAELAVALGDAGRAAALCSDNALRVLETGWGKKRTVPPPL